MDKRTRKLTLSALFTALTIVTLYISSIFPTGQLGIVAFASVFTAAAVIECGMSAGISVFAVSSLLGALLLPVKGAVLLYILFLGYYPITKYLIERLKKMVLEWVLKLVLFNAALSVVYIFFRSLIYGFDDGVVSGVLLFILGNIVFIVFDYGYTKLIWLYINTISERIKRK